ncbi:MAG: hypothetical protein RBU37_26800, partial [Myxococcota bacterium]|nr:hypothetical protein [Myxococcota bacterium]
MPLRNHSHPLALGHRAYSRTREELPSSQSWLRHIAFLSALALFSTACATGDPSVQPQPDQEAEVDVIDNDEDVLFDLVDES